MSDAPDAPTTPTTSDADETPEAAASGASAAADAGQEPAGAPAPEAPTSGGGVKAKPVTRKMLQAAARAPTDVVHILKAEANALKKRAERGEAPPKRERKHTQSSVIEAARALHAKHESEDDLPVVDDSPPPPAPAGRTLAPTRPPEQPRLEPTRPEPTPPPPPAATQRPDARVGSQLPLAAAVLLAGVLVAGATVFRAPAPASPQVDAAPTPAAATSTQTPALPPTHATANDRPGAVAELGDNRVLYTAERGELVVLWRDPSSGELEVERVYSLSRDPARDLGQAERRYHAWYLDDLHVTRKAELRKAHSRYEAMVSQAQRTLTGVEQAEAAAAKLARMGGADRLVKHLDGSSGAIHHRSAAIGLAQAGYVCAVPHLIDLLRRHGGSRDFAQRLIDLLGRLTSLTLPKETAGALEQVEAWQTANPLKGTYQRVD